MKQLVLLLSSLLGLSCGNREVTPQELAAISQQELKGARLYEGRENGFDHFIFTYGMSTKNTKTLKLAIADSPVTLPFARGSRQPVHLSEAVLECITPARQVMGSIVASFCIDPSPDNVGPHAQAEYELFVNGPGLQWKIVASKNHFPLGSVILKTKFHPGAAAAHFATRMTKIGDAGGAEDWKYESLEIPSGRPLPCDERKCLRCHQDWDRQDYVSPDTWRWLELRQNALSNGNPRPSPTSP